MEPISAADQAVLGGLVDPDAAAQTVNYHWDEDFQRVLVGMLLCDRYFLAQSMGLIKPFYFRNEIHQTACRVVLDYFAEYRQMPSKVWVKQAVTDGLRKRYKTQPDTFDAARVLYLGELNTLYDYYGRGGVGDMMPGLDSPEAILDKITAFAKTQALKEALHKCYELVKKDPEADETWDEVHQTLKGAMLVERQTDMGLEYFTTVEDRYARMARDVETADVFTTGFETIDRSLHGGGLRRGEIAAWMATPGTGKSLSLVVASVKNIVRGKKVLYISTEMDPDRIAMRFDAQFSLVGHDKLLLRKEEVWRALRDEVRDYDDKRRLVIKQFPSGTADMNAIRAYHSQCVMHGYRPDLVILDYPGDMKHPANVPLHQSMQRMVTELRGLGVEENHLTLIAIQPNRGATELGAEEFMDESKQGDSFGQNRVLDAFWTLNQTAHERNAAVCRVFVAKARNGQAKITFKVRFGYETQTLTMEEITHETYMTAMNAAKDATAREIKMNNFGIPQVGAYVPTDGERAG